MCQCSCISGKTSRWLYRCILPLFLVMGGVLYGSRLSSFLFANVGMLAFCNSVQSASIQSDIYLEGGMYPLSGLLHREDVETSLSMLQQAVVMNSDSSTIRWELGRILLAEGNTELAAKLMKPLVHQAKCNPLLYQDAWIAFSKGGLFEPLIFLYENAPFSWPAASSSFRAIDPCLRKRLINDTIALAYLKTEGKDALTKIIKLRPQDLYANFYLWADATRNDNPSAAMYRNTLAEFSLEAVSPADKRLLDYAVAVIPELLEANIWDRRTALHVITFLLYTYNGTVELEDPLQRLIKRYPDEIDWLFYLAEFYRLRKNWGAAEKIYRHIVDIDPQYPIPYLRLGMLAQAKCETLDTLCVSELEEAIKWYEQYNRLSPDNLIGLERLSKAYKYLAQIEGKEYIVAEKWEGKWLARVYQCEIIEVNQALDNGWVFIGYSGNEERLARGEPTSLLLYWKVPAGVVAGDERTGWYQIGDERWVQILEEAHNMLFDGGFEFSSLNKIPISFPYDVYEAFSVTRNVSVEKRNGYYTNVALLSNTNADVQSSFASLYMPVDPGALYLQIGWMRSDGGKAFLGRRWAGNLPKKKKRYGYIAANITSKEWQRYAGIAVPMIGSQWIQVWLLNSGATGQVFFDDVSLVKISQSEAMRSSGINVKLSEHADVGH